MTPRVLDPEVARRVRNLSFEARRAVEGLLSGSHRSPHRGASVVFVEHRDYRPGDDVRLLDWRAYARTDRNVVKRFQQETELRATLVLDRSGSMAYGQEAGETKCEHGAALLAALAYVLVGQGDAVGASLISDRVDQSVPPRNRPAHLDVVLGLLATRAAEGICTDLASALSSVAERAGRRGVVAIASDLLDPNEDALKPLHHLVARGHDVIVLHVLHPNEVDFPFEGPSRFVGLEGEAPIEADAEAVRQSYHAEMERFLTSRKAACIGAGARYALARTDTPPERTLAEILTTAQRRGLR